MRTLFFTLLLSISAQSFAQRWLPAKVVLVNSDTVKGLARIADDRVVFLKKEGTFTVQKYNYREAKLVYLDDELFASTQFVNVKDGKGKTIFDSSFVKVLIAGDINLYYKKNKGNSESPKSFVIQKNDSSATELINKTINVEQFGLTHKVQLNAYRNQIKKMLEGCPSIENKLTRDFYTEERMTAVIKKYIDCKGLSTKYIQKNKQRRVEISLLAGWDITKIKFTSTLYYLSPTYTYSQKPFFGAQFALPLSKKGRLKMIVEPMYKSTSIKMDTSIPGIETSQTSIDVNYLHLNVGLKQTFSVAKHLNVDFLGALSYGFVLSRKFTRTIDHSYQNNEFGFSDSEADLFLGIGIRFYERFGLTIRDEVSLSDFTTYDATQTTSSHVYYGITYRLSK